MPTAAEIQAKITKLSTNMDRFDGITNGSDTTTVTTDSGSVPSVAKFFKDLQTDYDSAGTSPRVQLKNVLAGIGDSYIDPDGGGTIFFGRLMTLLAAQSWEVANFGSGGETSTEVRNRFATQLYDAADARVLYISCGINTLIIASATSTELNEGSSARTARMIAARDLVISDLSAMYISAAASSGAHKIVAATLPPVKGATFVVSPAGYNPGSTQPIWNSDIQNALDYVNNWIATTATGRTNVLDVYSILNDTGNPGQIKSAFNNDFIHPNIDGYTAMADALYALPGVFVEASASALIYTTQPADRRPLRFNQSLRNFDFARFTGLALGWASTKFRPFVVRSRDPALDEEQIAILQRYGNGSDGFFVHVNDFGNFVLSRLAGGVKQAAVLTVSGSNTVASILLGGIKLVSDTVPLFLQTTTFTGSLGQAFSLAVKSSTAGIAGGPGYTISVYGAGAGTLGTVYASATEWNFDGVTRVIAQAGYADFRFARQPAGGGAVADQTRIVHDGLNFIIGNPALSAGVFLPNGAASWSTMSSRELKERIANIAESQAVSRIQSLQMVEFYWKAHPERDFPERGVIAEDAESIYPDLVSTGIGGKKGFNYAGLQPDAIVAIQVLLRRVSELENALKQKS